MDKKLIFQKGSAGRKNNYIRKPFFYLQEPHQIIPKEFLREELSLPSLGELEVVRHYTNLARLNFSLDTNFYPLGSCTMKYNPKVNEELANLEGFTQLHPYQKEEDIQGALGLIYNLEKILCQITGMSKFTFQASSGAQGELIGMAIIRKYHDIKGNRRRKVIVPDSSHGTNPATASLCGYEVVVVDSNKEGLVDIDKLYKLADKDVAAIMLTNPNTLGLFEENILEISDIIHKQGGFLYYDGANFNPLLGITNPALMGFDVIHLNFHKTFSTPHGCGGPGAGAVGVVPALADFLPVPVVEKKRNKFYFNYKIKLTIGRVRSFYGNFAVLIKAYVYLLMLGKEGLLRVAQNSVINANYIKEKLKDCYKVAYNKRCMHEIVFSCDKQKEKGVTALDIAKRLLDYQIHPPTMYFPLTVKEALMVEPTETENKETLDYFVKTMMKIDKDINQDPIRIKNSPHTTPVRRVDEVSAARSPNLRYDYTNET
ncbi:MAG: aminomethyl-transferring glycine dehydrogenase subunit GcvPB [Candidatus Omnitrophota bacterium]|nr:MAG: aminomethyl-transferring glycine dehydrogenase subunit GcvPB [Candidatus Omnitrophota bacterium]